MLEAEATDALLSRARAEEKKYEWLKAADYYQGALNKAADSDFLRKGEISENLAYAVYKAAFQVDNSDEFKQKMGQALTCYKEAKRLYEESEDTKKIPRIYRCDAMIAFADYWQASTAIEKRKAVEECWTQAKKALDSFGAEEKTEFGRTFAQLSLSKYVLCFFLDADGYYVCANALNEGIRYGERAVAFLSESGDEFTLTKAYVQTAIYQELFGVNLPTPADKERLEQKALNYVSRARELSEETALLECYYILGTDFGSEKSAADAAKSLDYARKSRDRFAVGGALTFVALDAFYRGMALESSDERAEMFKKALDCAEDARNEFAKISWPAIPYDSGFWIQSPSIRYFLALAMDETDMNRRRSFLQKALDSAAEGFRLAEQSGLLMAMEYMHSVSSRVYMLLANTVAELERRKFLEQALHHVNEDIKIVERVGPFLNFYVGSRRGYLGDIKCQIANLAVDLEERKNLLREAIELKREGLNLMHKDLSGVFSQGKMYYASYVSSQFGYAEMLMNLFKLTGEKELLDRAAVEYRQAAETYRRMDFVSRSAECWWKYAQACDVQGEHMKAAESFATASKDYKEAERRIPKLNDLYGNLSAYMEGWSEIERGKHCHKREEYGLAQSHFEKAASWHKSSKRWGYLAQNYAAWAEMENAENLSRRGSEDEASKSFQRASDLFGEASREIRASLGKIEDVDEAQTATSMLKATDLRRSYCKARIAIEEARILDKKGEHESSGRQYGLAAEMFDKVAQELESETDRRECLLISNLAKAWQKMANAEAEESTKHYDAASGLFEKAKDFAPSEKTKALVLGHSRFCKALEAGKRFVDTQDMSEYVEAMKQLESAANYYLKADFQNAYEYTKATRLLFDANLHMANAAKETDPEKKTREYMIAEKALVISADSYRKAEDPSKQERALRLLEMAREQRDLAISFAEVLQAPIVSSTNAFSAPTPTSEKATGLERFEHAEVEANLILSRNEFKVGEDVELEIDVANAGKGQALLSLIEGVIPEAFEIRRKPEAYRVEGFNINMKGKRLEPLKAEEVKLTLKPKRKGTFTLEPRIVYLDENGNAKSHKPEPMTITVGELGIKGWLKGER